MSRRRNRPDRAALTVVCLRHPLQSNPLLRIFYEDHRLAFEGADVTAVQAHEGAPHTFIGRCHHPGCRITCEARVTRIGRVMDVLRERLGARAAPVVTSRQFEAMLGWVDLPAESLGQETLVAVALGRTVWKL